MHILRSLRGSASTIALLGRGRWGYRPRGPSRLLDRDWSRPCRTSHSEPPIQDGGGGGIRSLSWIGVLPGPGGGLRTPRGGTAPGVPSGSCGCRRAMECASSGLPSSRGHHGRREADGGGPWLSLASTSKRSESNRHLGRPAPSLGRAGPPGRPLLLPKVPLVSGDIRIQWCCCHIYTSLITRMSDAGFAIVTGAPESSGYPRQVAKG